MQLILIEPSGEVAGLDTSDDFLAMVIQANVEHFQKVGYEPPWIGYVAVEDGTPVGTCAFKTPPQEGRVEIAYGTSPGFERRGIATKMARQLIQIAAEHQSAPTVTAQTLPEENASTSVLKKNGFRLFGPVEHPEDGTVWQWELSEFGVHTQTTFL
jgi:RimJ/RimL family protein N-acetyltransferase